MKFLADHDLHCHSSLSACCEDARMTPEAMLRRAEALGLSALCITDHLWDAAVPGASSWYAPQDIEHVKGALPLPQSDAVRFLFGCETEYCGGGKLGLAPEHFDLFDFIVIPPNHFHMRGFVRPEACGTEEAVAELLVRRLTEISRMDLPFEKVGIAHMTCSLTMREGDPFRVFELVDEYEYRAAMRAFAMKGAGIELNAGVLSVPPGREEAGMRLYRLAREEGCRFYVASDAHSLEHMDYAPQVQAFADALGLTEEEKYTIP